jgi:hypothetical protein
MNYDTMTIESLADDCFKRSGYKINKADLISRITHLCENPQEQIKELKEKLKIEFDKGYYEGAKSTGDPF